jgi:biopolymer transport protein ExbB/TolQ
VAIPALIFHHALDQRVKRCAFEMDYFGAALIRLLTGRSETTTVSESADA